MYKKKVKKSKKSKHKPPSRITYEKNNPVISFRIKKEWKKQFKKFLKDNNLSIGDFFRISFKKQKANYKRAETRGYNRGLKIGDSKGYKRGVSDWRIWYYCDICGEVEYIYPNSDHHKEIIKYTKEQKWVHKECYYKSNMN